MDKIQALNLLLLIALLLLTLNAFPCRQFTTDEHQVRLILMSGRQNANFTKLNNDKNLKYKYDSKSNHQTEHLPVVMWHGMGDTAHGSVESLSKAMQQKYPGIRIYSVQVGSNSFVDRLSSYYGNVNDQIHQVCKLINENQDIVNAGRVNFVGFSQGSQFLRGLIQRCNFVSGLKPRNFISLGGQHQGVFGLPNCGQIEDGACDQFRILLRLAYEPIIQNRSIQAQYWHDPLNEASYKTGSVFLADINNELKIDQSYKQNLLKLDNFVMVEFAQDETVVPRESSVFGFYAPGKTSKILPLEQSSLYTKDKLGLKQLAESGLLTKLVVPGDHLEFTIKWFLKEIATKYLEN